MANDTHARSLAELANHLIATVTEGGLEVREGTVMTLGPAPYRRLDCDGRALAYVRPRPKKRLVRVDISGLWVTPRGSRLSVPTAAGSASLLVRHREDMDEAKSFLEETVQKTREAFAKERDRTASGA